MKIRSTFIAFASLIAVLSLPAMALAQDSSVDTYGGTGGEVAAEVGESGTPPSSGDDLAGLDSGGSLPGDAAAEEGTLAQNTGTDSDDEGGTLPFTGSDTLILGLGGLLLVAVGAAVAKISARMRQSDAPA